MPKETEKRLIKTLEFLKEPQGSTIPTIVKAIKNNDPKISLKRIVQTLKGCLDNGVVKVADGRVKLKQIGGLSDGKSNKCDDLPEYSKAQSRSSRSKNPCSKSISRCQKTCQGTPSPDAPPDNPDNPDKPPDDPKCKPKKPKPKCKKPKPKCPKKKKPKCKPKKKKCPPKKKSKPCCPKKPKCPNKCPN